MIKVKNADICCGLSWGDEGKGKIVTELLKNYNYDWVCRFGGGSNAGHTIYLNEKKYKTNLVPSGIFYDKKCYIGPQCFVNLEDLDSEMEYLSNNGFDISNIKVSLDVHIITNNNKEEDNKKYTKTQGSTGKGIAPCSRDKFARTGIKLKDILNVKTYFEKLKYFCRDNNLMNEELCGDILCEGAQGFWLDIDYGNYPFVTSSIALPYSACSLGFPPQLIRNIYGGAKIYDTRVGIDPDFDDKLLNDKVLNKIAIVGNEFGTTTGRQRKVNWLNLDKLITATNISGTTHLIISKVDILEQIKVFKLIFNEKIIEFTDIKSMKLFITNEIMKKNNILKKIIYSDSPNNIDFNN